MKAISLFSGVGGIECGFERAGIQTMLQAENDPWCLSVLERHWPGCERVDDVRKVDASTWPGRRGDVVGVGAGSDSEWLGGASRSATSTGAHPRIELGRRGEARPGLSSGIDLVYGGFPCQDLSVAGNRAGFRGERSSLWFEFQRVLSELRPQWCLIENVPGLLSSDSGRDMATVLGGLGDLGYGWAYRVLDARWFGVPQRRRRVFIVGCLGDAARAAAVLAVCESCGGHPQARREAGEDIAPTLNASVRGTGDGHGNALNSNYVADDIAPTLDDGARRASVEPPMIAVARSLTSRNERIDAETENLLVASTVRASDGHHGHSSPRGDGGDNLIAFQSNAGARLADELSEDYFGPVRKGSGGASAAPPAISGEMGVRRLTPLECERLMAFPDDWTRYTADGREIPDSHRYRMCGNGVVATVAEWIGRRLVWVDQAMRQEQAA